MIPHSRPTLNENDVSAIEAVVRGGMIAQGIKVEEFERSMAKFTGVEGGVAVSSGTAALHLALIALGAGKDSEILIPAFTCEALLNAVRYVEATAVLVDIDPETYNMDPRDLRKKMTGRSKAIILPHMFGLPADLDEIISEGLPVIEDCALSLGAKYKGKYVGSYGRLAILSFYATKVITSGEGGMVISNDRGILEKIRDLREYDGKKDNILRYNYKLTDMQGALGLSQLSRLETFITQRRNIARKYFENLTGLGLCLPVESADKRHIYYRFVISLGSIGLAVERFIDLCDKKGVSCRRPVFMPLSHYLHIQGIPNTEEAWRQTVSIPIYPSLDDGKVDRVIEAVAEAVIEK
jgi:perosamine synthetase